MAESTEVMREYLIRLGYQTDAISLRKFEDSLGKTGKQILKVGTNVTGMVAAIAASVTAFSYHMRQMYATSSVANSSVKNLESMSFAAKQVGIEGSQMESVIKNLGLQIKNNPQITGLLNSLGVETGKRDTSDILKDLVGTLSKMPRVVSNQFAGMFGMDPEMFDLFLTYYGKFLEKQKLALDVGKQYNLNLDDKKVKETLQSQADTWDLIGLRVKTLSEKYLVTMAPTINEGTIALEKFFQTYSDYLDDPLGHLEKGWNKIKQNFGVITNPIAAIGSYSAQLGADYMLPKTANASIASINPALNLGIPGTSPPSGTQAMFAEIERKYGLPPGTVDTAWKLESTRGKNMLSPAGAEGHFGFMPATSKEFGLKNPYDLTESAWAFGRKMGGIYKATGGDLYKSAAIYNEGEGNYAKGRMPFETQNYAAGMVQGVTFHQTVNNHITTTGDANSIEKPINRAMGDANHSALRNLQQQHN